jgi:hypothetical protein
MPKGIRPKKKNNYDSIGFRNSAIERINKTPGDVEIYNPSTGKSYLTYAPAGSEKEKKLHASLKKKRKNHMDKK